MAGRKKIGSGSARRRQASGRRDKRSTPTSPPPEQRPKKWFWPAVAVVLIVFAAETCWDIGRPFYGLHAWNEAAAAWRARTLLKYPLSYTHGAAVWAVGDPPPENPNRSFNHPQLGHIIRAAVFAVLGQSEWAYRSWHVLSSLVGVAAFMALLRRLADEYAALLAGLILVLLPVNAYFVPGFGFALGIAQLWCYFALIGELRPGLEPKTRHYWGLAAASFVAIQCGWSGVFLPAAIGLHYLARCLIRRQRPKWKLLVTLVVPPVLSLLGVFLVMLAGLGWDVQKIVDLYVWRGAKGEMREFVWRAWFDRLWEFSLLDFTWAVIAAVGAYVVVHAARWVMWRFSPTATSRSPWPACRVNLLLWFLPGVMLLLVFRGALWAHQYWLKPLGPPVAICAALAVHSLWRLVRWRWRSAVAAHAAALALLALFAVLCGRGTSYFYGIRWHRKPKIEMLRQIRRRVPPDKALLSFESFMVDQHKVKGAHYRPEIAWYLDRPIVQAPDQQTFRDVTNRVFQIVVGAERAKQRVVELRQTNPRGWQEFCDRVGAERDRRLADVLKRHIPRLVEQIEQKARTGRFPCYLVPTNHIPQDPVSLGSQAVGLVFRALNEELAKRYPRLFEVPGKEVVLVVRNSKKRLFKVGMSPYAVYDLTASRGDAAAPRRPG